MNHLKQVLAVIEDIESEHPRLSRHTQLLTTVLSEDIELSLRIDRCKKIISEINSSDMTLQMQLWSLTSMLSTLSGTEHERAPPDL